jgi:hypothetical protein
MKISKFEAEIALNISALLSTLGVENRAGVAEKITANLTTNPRLMRDQNAASAALHKELKDYGLRPELIDGKFAQIWPIMLQLGSRKREV